MVRANSSHLKSLAVGLFLCVTLLMPMIGGASQTFAQNPVSTPTPATASTRSTTSTTDPLVELVLVAGNLIPKIQDAIESPLVKIALAIDRNLAQRISYPFAWSAGVFTLVTPLVSHILGLAVYTTGNLAFKIISPEMGIFTLDANGAITGDPARITQAVYACIVLTVIMVLSALLLLASPYISYKLAFGQVFEAISTTASGWLIAASASNRPTSRCDVKNTTCASVRPNATPTRSPAARWIRLNTEREQSPGLPENQCRFYRRSVTAPEPSPRHLERTMS